jgi:hypothetical protein
MVTMTTFRNYCALSLLLTLSPVLGYQPQLQLVERREAFGLFLAGSAILAAGGPPANAANVLRSKGCYQGEGEACAELAEDNVLIKSLQEKSATNREKNEKVCSTFTAS